MSDLLKERDKRLLEIKNELLELKESPLYEYRMENNFFPVIGEGSSKSLIMFIGEAPGKNEAISGRPFCGTAGKVLDELLAFVNISREEIYITNILKDRPPENRDPFQNEIDIYGPFLNRQIEIIKPRVIVSLGRYSMGYIMNKFGLETELEPIGKAHGKIYNALSSYGDVNIITLYHPCVAVYNRSKIDLLKKDFKILGKLNKRP